MGTKLKISLGDLKPGMVCVGGLGAGCAPKTVVSVLDTGNRGVHVTYITQFGETCRRVLAAATNGLALNRIRPVFVEVLA